MDVLVVGTDYTLLLYLLLKKNWSRTFFIIGSTVSENAVKGLKKQKVKYHISKDFRYIKNPYLRWGLISFEKLKYYRIVKKIKMSKPIVYGHDHINEAIPFINSSFIVLEDGVGNYEGALKLKKRLHMENNIRYVKGKEYIPLGYDTLIKKLYLTKKNNIPNELLPKVEVLNIEDLWADKKEKEKESIMDIFSFNLKEIKKIIKSRSTFLLTQPYSEVGIISEEKKINIYKEILKKYSYQNIIIKKHPREKTDYKKIFPQYTIIEEAFPFELLRLNDINISKIVTIDSSPSMDTSTNMIIETYGEFLK